MISIADGSVSNDTVVSSGLSRSSCKGYKWFLNILSSTNVIKLKCLLPVYLGGVHMGHEWTWGSTWDMSGHGCPGVTWWVWDNLVS